MRMKDEQLISVLIFVLAAFIPTIETQTNTRNNRQFNSDCSDAPTPEIRRVCLHVSQKKRFRFQIFINRRSRVAVTKRRSDQSSEPATKQRRDDAACRLTTRHSNTNVVVVGVDAPNAESRRAGVASTDSGRSEHARTVRLSSVRLHDAAMLVSVLSRNDGRRELLFAERNAASDGLSKGVSNVDGQRTPTISLRVDGPEAKRRIRSD